jgi:hypothetical protein
MLCDMALPQLVRETRLLGGGVVQYEASLAVNLGTLEGICWPGLSG